MSESDIVNNLRWALMHRGLDDRFALDTARAFDLDYVKECLESEQNFQEIVDEELSRWSE